MDEKKAFKIFFNHTSNAGVVFYRIVNFANQMSKQKTVSIAYSKFDPMNQAGQQWENALEIRGYAESLGLSTDKILDDMDMLMDIADVSIWQTCHTMSSHALFLRYRDKFTNKKPIITEIDDYLFGVNPENAGYDSFYPNSNPEYFAEMQIRNSNFLIVSTNWLKDGDDVFPGLKFYNKSIECIPNSIDFDIWDKLKNQKSKKRIRIGWSGGQAHYNDLKIIKKVVPAILQKYKNVEFVFFGAMPDYIETSDRCRHYNRWYSIYDYPKELAGQGFNIGLAPLRDNLFNRAKSNLRWLEYSALKIPTIASPRVPFQECENILFAEELDEWVEKISNLIEDENLRNNLGLKAYNELREKYDVKKTSLKYLETLKAIVEGRRPITKMRYDEKGNPFIAT